MESKKAKNEMKTKSAISGVVKRSEHHRRRSSNSKMKFREHIGTIKKRRESNTKDKEKSRRSRRRSFYARTINATATLNAVTLSDVKLPMGDRLEEWLALGAVECLNQALAIYGLIAEKCTCKSCPVMNAARGFRYAWRDGKEEKPKDLSAPEYINKLFDWIEVKLKDTKLYPLDEDSNIPAQTKKVTKVSAPNAIEFVCRVI